MNAGGGHHPVPQAQNPAAGGGAHARRTTSRLQVLKGLKRPRSGSIPCWSRHSPLPIVSLEAWRNCRCQTPKASFIRSRWNAPTGAGRPFDNEPEADGPLSMSPRLESSGHCCAA